jgi:hypothetical protein
MEVTVNNKLGSYVSFGAMDAAKYIVGGVRPEIHDGAWRWGQRQVELQFQLTSLNHPQFQADLTVPDIVFRDTGAVAIQVSVAGHALGSVEFTKDGRQVFRKEVPRDWLRTGEPVHVVLESDKEWTDRDGSKYGFILTSAGFVQ